MNPSKSNPICKVWNCGEEGLWLPVLTLVPEDSPSDTKPDVVELTVLFCNRHRLIVKIQDILDDEVWASLSQYFEGQGRLMPKREAIGLDFMHTEMGFPC